MHMTGTSTGHYSQNFSVCVVGKLSTCITDDSCKTGSAYVHWMRGQWQDC